MEQRPPKNRIPWLSVPEDRSVLIICMVIALVFWFLTKMSKAYVTEKPVVFQVNIPDGKALKELPARDMYATIRSTGWNLMAEFFLSPEVQLDVEFNGRESLFLDGAQLRDGIQKKLSVREIEITDLNYAGLSLQLEPREDIVIPVVLRYHMDLAPMHQLSGPFTISPDSVLLSGPASVVGQYTEWPTDSFSLNDLRTTQTLDVPLAEPSPAVQVKPSEIQVTIPVEEVTEKSLFVELQVKNAPVDSIRLFPQRVRVRCVVGLSRYNDVIPDSFQVVIDLGHIAEKQNKHTVPIQVAEAPSFVSNISISPKSAEFVLVQEATNQ